MSERVRSAAARVALLCGVVVFATGAQVWGQAASQPQAPRQAGTLVIAGQNEQAPLLRMNGKWYVDIESLARVTHGTVAFQGSQTVLTLPGTAGAGGAGTASAAKPPELSGGFLSAEIEALTQIREWRVSLVNAIGTNYPVSDDWVGGLRRSAQAKLQLAMAAATTELDQKSAELLRNEYTNMQQESDQFVDMHSKASYISPDTLENNALDGKILGCERALAAMAASKQYQDEAQCH